MLKSSRIRLHWIRMLKAHYHEPNRLQTEKKWTKQYHPTPRPLRKSNHERIQNFLRTSGNIFLTISTFHYPPSTLNLHLSNIKTLPSTLNPQLWTLNPQPNNPLPSTLTFYHSTFQPPTSTLNPQPSNLNPNLKPVPSTLNPQLSTLNPQTRQLYYHR